MGTDTKGAAEPLENQRHHDEDDDYDDGDGGPSGNRLLLNTLSVYLSFTRAPSVKTLVSVLGSNIYLAQLVSRLRLQLCQSNENALSPDTHRAGATDRWLTSTTIIFIFVRCVYLLAKLAAAAAALDDDDNYGDTSEFSPRTD